MNNYQYLTKVWFSLSVSALYIMFHFPFDPTDSSRVNEDNKMANKCYINLFCNILTFFCQTSSPVLLSFLHCSFKDSFLYSVTSTRLYLQLILVMKWFNCINGADNHNRYDFTGRGEHYLVMFVYQAERTGTTSALMVLLSVNKERHIFTSREEMYHIRLSYS